MYQTYIKCTNIRKMFVIVMINGYCVSLLQISKKKTRKMAKDRNMQFTK